MNPLVPACCHRMANNLHVRARGPVKSADAQLKSSRLAAREVTAAGKQFHLSSREIKNLIDSAAG